MSTPPPTKSSDFFDDDDDDLFKSVASHPATEATHHLPSGKVSPGDLFADAPDEINLNDDDDSFQAPAAKLELDTSGEKGFPLAEEINELSHAHSDAVPETPPLLSGSESSSGRPSPPTVIPSGPAIIPANPSVPLSAAAILEPESYAESGKRDESAKKSKGPPVIAAKPAKLFEENEDDRHNAKQSDADQSAASVFKPAAVPRRKNKEEEEEETDENHLIKLEISIADYERRGDGMNAYVAYRVATKTHGTPGFFKSEYDVWRRFSDFLGLHEKLAAKYLHSGRIVPPAPEKSVVGMTKTKMSKEVADDQSAAHDFLERRRTALERFIRRTAQHPVLAQDPDFRDFLTTEAELPRASQTSALSGAGVMRLLGKVSDSFTKITGRIENDDQWFEEKQMEVETMDEQLRKLHASMEQLVLLRKELASTTDIYCKAMQSLAACEESTALSRAFSQLVETQEKVGMVFAKQADKDFYLMAETLKDYVNLIATVKAVFLERIKVWQMWQNAQQTLAKKREAKTKFELAGKSDKLPLARAECDEWEKRVDQCQEQFERMSKMIRKEMKRFDAQRVHDFKQSIVQYLESLALTQQQVVKYWEAFLPEAKAISV